MAIEEAEIVAESNGKAAHAGAALGDDAERRRETSGEIGVLIHICTEEFVVGHLESLRLRLQLCRGPCTAEQKENKNYGLAHPIQPPRG
jgi:hypothetical protein